VVPVVGSTLGGLHAPYTSGSFVLVWG